MAGSLVSLKPPAMQAQLRKKLARLEKKRQVALSGPVTVYSGQRYNGMRVDLRVPYEEKDVAKKHGARWDPTKKVWYVIDPPNLAVFHRWLPTLLQRATHKHSPEPTPLKGGGDHRRLKDGIRTIATDLSLPDCDCTTPPWEDCNHSIPVASEHLSHLKAILLEPV